MATHSSILAWEIPWTERSLAGYNSWGHKELETTEGLTPSPPTLWKVICFTNSAYINVNLISKNTSTEISRIMFD